MLPFWSHQKLTIFFRIAKPNLVEFLKFPRHGFGKTTAVRQKRRQAKREGTCELPVVMKL